MRPRPFDVVPHLQALRNATRSASSWGVSCWSRPAGMTETVPGRISSMSSRGMRVSVVGAGRQDDLVGGVLAEQAVEDLAVGGGDDDRLVALHEAGAGEDDRLQQVALGADLADARQVGADLAAEVADGVAGGAGRLGAVEDRLAAADVAGLSVASSSSSLAVCSAASASSEAYSCSACVAPRGRTSPGAS